MARRTIQLIGALGVALAMLPTGPARAQEVPAPPGAELPGEQECAPEVSRDLAVETFPAPFPGSVVIGQTERVELLLPYDPGQGRKWVEVWVEAATDRPISHPLEREFRTTDGSDSFSVPVRFEQGDGPARIRVEREVWHRDRHCRAVYVSPAIAPAQPVVRALPPRVEQAAADPLELIGLRWLHFRFTPERCAPDGRLTVRLRASSARWTTVRSLGGCRWARRGVHGGGGLRVTVGRDGPYATGWAPAGDGRQTVRFTTAFDGRVLQRGWFRTVMWREPGEPARTVWETHAHSYLEYCIGGGRTIRVHNGTRYCVVEGIAPFWEGRMERVVVR